MLVLLTILTTLPFLLSTLVIARPQARGLLPAVDICANIDINVFALLHIPDTTSAGSLQACICASTIRPFVQANVMARLASNLLDEDTVVNALLNLIIERGRQCRYPEHAVPFCLAGDPCNFGCADGYTRRDDACICQVPKIECNDVCQTQACSSAVPQKRSISGQFRMNVLANERCPRGHQLCGGGRSNQQSADDWECIDTRTSLESCGGCANLHMLDDHPVLGVDCTALPGVSDVECQSGRCFVHQCKQGWTYNSSRSGCVPESQRNNLERATATSSL